MVEKNLNQFAVYDSDTPVTLKCQKGQRHQTWHELADPKQGYNNAKFEKTSLEQCRRKSPR